ncbi:hypothetical protein KEM48_002550, partial [Puccinia striiformis f. sp. tritici PST-130]
MSRGRNRSQHKSSGASSIQSSQQPVEDEPEEVEVSPLTDQGELGDYQKSPENCPRIQCGTKISPPTTDSSCKQPAEHASNCLRKLHETEQNQTLAALGVTGTRDIDPKELCAVWCAEAARPFPHSPTLVIKPCSTRLFSRIYLRVKLSQKTYTYSTRRSKINTDRELQAHKGVLYLG